VKPEPKATAVPSRHEDPMPTGTFRNNYADDDDDDDDDGWDDLNFAEKTGGQGSSNKAFGNTGGNR
jgi:hypothetical protein